MSALSTNKCVDVVYTVEDFKKHLKSVQRVKAFRIALYKMENRFWCCEMHCEMTGRDTIEYKNLHDNLKNLNEYYKTFS